MSELIDHLAALGYEATHPDTPVPADYVDQVEEALGVLPADYRRFLEAYPRSAGIPGDAFLIPVEDARSSGTLSWSELYGVDLKPGWGLIRINRDLEEHGLDGMIIIGHDGYGNFYYMAIDDPQGPVFFKDLYKGEGSSLEDLAPVRASFAEFILASNGHAAASG